MSSILILGSEGFIGNNLVNHFEDTSYQVTGCDLYETAMHGDYRYHKVSRLSPEWEEIIGSKEFTYCVNAAGSGNVPYSMLHPVADFEANVLDTIRILDAIRRQNTACRYLHISSAAVYGNPLALPVKETAPTSPLSPYGFHKLMSEQICREYHQVYGLSIAIIRPFSVYGEGLRKQLFWDICSRLEDTDTIELFGTGKESRDFLHVRDLAVLIQKILVQSGFNCTVYNAGSGVETTLHMVASLVEKYFKNEKQITFSGEARKGDPINWKADIDAIKSLGFTPSLKLEQGIVGYIKWFQSL